MRKYDDPGWGSHQMLTIGCKNMFVVYKIIRLIFNNWDIIREHSKSTTRQQPSLLPIPTSEHCKTLTIDAWWLWLIRQCSKSNSLSSQFILRTIYRIWRTSFKDVLSWISTQILLCLHKLVRSKQIINFDSIRQKKKPISHQFKVHFSNEQHISHLSTCSCTNS